MADKIPLKYEAGEISQFESGDTISSTYLPSSGGQAFPIGAVFIGVVSTNPSTLLGYGTWSAFGAGRVLVGLDSGDPDFDTVEETGGAKTHTLTTAEMPSHTHVQNSHNHTQDSHNHSQNAHGHSFNIDGSTTPTNSLAATHIIGSLSAGSGARAANPGIVGNTATNNAATATNNAATATNQNTGGDGAHNNLQPYIVVYMWKRTA